MKKVKHESESLKWHEIGKQVVKNIIKGLSDDIESEPIKKDKHVNYRRKKKKRPWERR